METFPSYPVFKFNRDFPTASTITKHADSTHALTMTALSLIDKDNQGLQIEILCSGTAQIADYADIIKCMLQTLKVATVYFRSVKIDGVFQDTYLNLTLEQNDDKPSNYTQFKNKADVVCDIEIANDSQTWSMWRLAEPACRVLKLTSESIQIS